MMHRRLPFVLVAAAAAATPKKRTATPGLVLAKFVEGGGCVAD